ncbi:hypothetical protein I7Z51_002356 [Vibrio parahaemolyticus]|uniref:hypothetical protein n=1 Tax=Vibrio TaxID=662 RepID=UPI001A8D27FB|nr:MULTISPECIES: hypothetical protein [Vibrio]EGQ7973434.1 hypothetical protein [Vibrio parahaemolyticus]MBO0208664.1 hypothetical protein [Vibrio sp. Vb0877]MCR9809794.1 hypothetical protein [Vibrio parahaemolyticus]
MNKDTLEMMSKEQYALFREIAFVLNKYPKLKDKFGIYLVHEHFECQNEEVLYEKSDVDKRVSLTQPITQSLLPEGAFPSQWKISLQGDELNAKVDKWCCD